MRKGLIWLITVVWFLFSAPAWALTVAVVDFQQALTQVEEGKKVEAELQTLMQTKQTEVTQLQTQLQSQLQQYEQQRSLLSDAARAQKEQELQRLQMQAQQTAYQSEMEFQQIYQQKMQTLIDKMRDIAEELGAEKKYDLVLEVTESGMVYRSTSVTDITKDVISRYNAKHGG